MMSATLATISGMTTKRCPMCEQVKSYDEFVKNRSRYDGMGSYCKPCFAKRNTERNRANPEAAKAYRNEWFRNNPTKIREYKQRSLLKNKYGLTVEEYTQMLERQNGLCAICKQPPVGKPMLYVDHCHESGKARDLLCSKCNFAIGLLDEDVARVHRVAAYLLRHRTPNMKLEVN